jgi:hypothetical protein
MKSCTKCGAWTKDDEQLRCDLCNNWFPSTNSRTFRSGRNQKKSSRRSGLRNFDDDVVCVPVQTDKQEKIWSGERKQLGGFPEKFLNDFLDEYYQCKNGLNPNKLTKIDNSGVPNYQCIKCKDHFAQKRQSTNNEWISIDHRVPIRERVLDKIDICEQYIDGHLWEFYILEECKAAHLDKYNLDPMCQTCNSRAGGNKELDGSMIEHSVHCNHRNCRGGNNNNNNNNNNNKNAKRKRDSKSDDDDDE